MIVTEEIKEISKHETGPAWFEMCLVLLDEEANPRTSDSPFFDDRTQ
jgi:hypothetical protein